MRSDIHNPLGHIKVQPLLGGGRLQRWYRHADHRLLTLQVMAFRSTVNASVGMQRSAIQPATVGGKIAI
jgi:hypothetical protein